MKVDIMDRALLQPQGTRYTMDVVPELETEPEPEPEPEPAAPSFTDVQSMHATDFRLVEYPQIIIYLMIFFCCKDR